MKRFLLCLFVAMVSLSAVAQDHQELLSLPVGGNRLLELAFNIENYKITPDNGYIRVETIDGMDNRVRITALAMGDCTLVLSGGGIQRNYRISVVSNTASLLKRLREDFRDVTELDMSINQDTVIIKGTVTNHEKWQHVVNVLKRYNDNNIRNDARFWPSQAAIKDLRRSLEAIGCKITDEADEAKRAPGEIYMTLSSTAIVLAGREFTEDKFREIQECLKTFSWLAINKEPSRELGQVSLLLNIKTISDIEMTFQRISRDLRDLKELTIEKTRESIDIRGTLTSPKKWNYMQEILTSIGNQNLIRNFAEFTPSAETMTELEQSFEAAGYECIKTNDVKNGQLHIELKPASLNLTAEVGSDAEAEEIRSILQDQAWLALPGEKPKHGQLRARANISVVPVNIAVDIAFVAIDSGDMETLGATGELKATLSASRLYDFVLGRTTEKSATFGGNMDKTLEFMANNNISRSYRAGTVKFKNNTSGEIVLGGTKYLRTAEDVREVNYGFRLNVSGNQLNKRKIELRFDVENSFMKDSDDKSEQTTHTELICDLDKTMMLGGFTTITDSIGNSGLPYLRNIPVLKWFVSQDNNNKSDLKLVMLASPHICDESENIPIVIDGPDAEKVYYDTVTPMKEDEIRKNTKGAWWKPNTWFRK